MIVYSIPQSTQNEQYSTILSSPEFKKIMSSQLGIGIFLAPKNCRQSILSLKARTPGAAVTAPGVTDYPIIFI